MSIKNSRNAPLARHPSQNGFVLLKAILTACTILLSSLYLAQDFLLFDFGSSEERGTSGSDKSSGSDTSSVHKDTLKIAVIRASLYLLSSKHELLSGASLGFQFSASSDSYFFQVPHVFQVKCSRLAANMRYILLSTHI